MSKNAEDALLPTVSVGGKDFPIGPLTIHQVFRFKNLIAQVVATARARQAKRDTATLQAAVVSLEKERPTMRAALAERLNVAEDDLPGDQWEQVMEQFLVRRQRDELAETGYFGQVGLLLHAVESLTEHQLLQLAVLVLDRRTDTAVTFEFVEAHFALDWFLDALATFIENNNIPSIIKNSQRLGQSISMQISVAGLSQTQAQA